jgi:ribosomal protein S18 acetylase RimI-like enzyme
VKTVEIREATQNDNQALLDLQKKCPMGVDFVVAVDSSPDYFARSRPYENWHVFVAVENQQIIGSIACTIKNTLIQDKPVKTSYLYGMMVDPTKRRTGVATQLQQHIEKYLTKQKVALCHLLVMEQNTPSIRLCQKNGFQHLKESPRFSLMVYKPMKPQNEANIKPMTPTDTKDVVVMMNETYRDHDFYMPYTEETFQAYIQKLPQDNPQNILVFKQGNDIQACLGYWDFNKIIRDRILKLNTRLRAISLPIRFLGLFTRMPKIPKSGETLKQLYLFPLAYKDATAMAELIKHVSNLALKNNITTLVTAQDDQSPLIGVLANFRNVQTKTHHFAKPLQKTQILPTRERKLYTDITYV